jgi:hypothetical protein
VVKLMTAAACSRPVSRAGASDGWVGGEVEY